MGYQSCDICNKNITNDAQYYLCEQCWEKHHVSKATGDKKYDPESQTELGNKAGDHDLDHFRGR